MARELYLDDLAAGQVYRSGETTVSEAEIGIDRPERREPEAERQEDPVERQPEAQGEEAAADRPTSTIWRRARSTAPARRP
jgi:hypothetical protein